MNDIYREIFIWLAGFVGASAGYLIIATKVAGRFRSQDDHPGKKPATTSTALVQAESHADAHAATSC